MVRWIQEQTITEYLSNKDLDLKKSHNARFFDQKVQPDVVSGVCESLLFCLKDATQEFTASHIKSCEYSEQMVTNFFNKPSVAKAPREYDKFFGQPLKSLAYAKLLLKIRRKAP